MSERNKGVWENGGARETRETRGERETRNEGNEGQGGEIKHCGNKRQGGMNRFGDKISEGR